MTFLSLTVSQCLLLCSLALVMILMLDAFQGHSRRGFYRWSQFLPFIFGGIYCLAVVLQLFTEAAFFFDLSCAALGLIGFIGCLLHQVFGIARKPGGYSWFFHYLMYGPTALAPLGLSLASGIGYAAVHAGSSELLSICLCLLIAGSLAQSLVLHFRGAFNSLAMYLPYTFPLLSLVLLIITTWMATNGWLVMLTQGSLVATAFIGFIGAGMHLRGFDRQSGGLGIALFNVLSGPPAFAPLVFTIAGAIGLLSFYY